MDPYKKNFQKSTQHHHHAQRAQPAKSTGGFRDVRLPMSQPHNSTPRRFEEFVEAFDFFDQNQDGYITTQELELAMSKCGVYPSKLELRLVMTQGDADGNGCITLNEFIQVLETQESRYKYEIKELREQFRFFDKNKDGLIDFDEMLGIVNELSLGRYFPIEIVQKLFNEADLDKDGKISFPEFVMAVN
ncbi:Calmodulin-like protein 3 [Aphelenchoides bicaudatus]|nr:Calmodulin-like protein 3 [Aphelenchoides bicaudatus]